MQPGRVVSALVVAPMFGALIYVLAVGLEGTTFSHGPSKDDLLTTFIGMAVVAVVFEVVVLLPAAVLMRRRQRFAVSLVAIGIVAWLGLVAGALTLMGQNAVSVAINSLQFLVLGVPVVLLFTAVVQKGLHA